MRKPNYDKYPATVIDGNILQGWGEIRDVLASKLSEKAVLAVDCYTGVYEKELIDELSLLQPAEIILVNELYKDEKVIAEMTERFMTDDVLFGYVTNLCLADYFDSEKLAAAQKKVSESNKPVIVLGTGAHMVAPEATLVYVDMARWEIQQRFRRHEVKALGIDNRNEAVSLQYKRGYFNDWRVCDRYKDSLFYKVDFWLDTHIAGQPKMIDREIALDEEHSFDLQPGSGPNKILFNKAGTIAYVLNELSCTINVYKYNDLNFELIQTIDTYPKEGYEDIPSTASQMIFSEKEERLYVTNCGHDSLSLFIVDKETGMLTYKDFVDTSPNPRDLKIFKDRWIVVVCQKGGVVESYEYRKERGGMLFETKYSYMVNEPVCITKFETIY